MTEFLTALGLVFVIEGVLYALFPRAMKKMILQIVDQPETALRTIGLVGTMIGVAIVWLAIG